MQALDLDRIIGYAFEEMVRGRQRFEPVVQFREKGEVTKVSAGVAIVSGLPGVGYEELVEFPNHTYGMVFNLEKDEVGVIIPVAKRFDRLTHYDYF